ncbi:MAG: ribosome recycling factor [Patescibacteria group bacterium]
MANIIDSYQNDFQKVIEFLKKEIAGLRISRANSTLVENLIVDAYGTKMMLKQLASISVLEGKTIIIQPWDKNNLKNIEKAFQTSSLGLIPIVDGDLIKISIPPLTEEKRKELIKILHQKAESARIGLRGVRDKIREEIFRQEREKKISEDEKYRLLKKLDEKTKEIDEEIKELVKEKEEEIMKI